MNNTKFVLIEIQIEIRDVVICPESEGSNVYTKRGQKRNKIIDIVMVLEVPESAEKSLISQFVANVLDEDYKHHALLYGANGLDLPIKYKICDLKFRKVNRFARFIF